MPGTDVHGFQELALRVQVFNNHILTQNLHHNLL